MAKSKDPQSTAATEPAEKHADGALPDAALDQASGGTTGMISNTMKASADTQSGLAGNLKAS
jgi:hypothetical protein